MAAVIGVQHVTAPPPVANAQLKAVKSESGPSLAIAQAKYNSERDKRMRPDGNAQFSSLFSQERFKHFQVDPWFDEKSDVSLGDPSPPEEGSRSEILVAGAGYAGLLFAVRLLQAGFKVEDIRMVDVAGGFGGTWYWNRYPGLMCDVESFIYMPLLEETGYVPTMKYTSSQELRHHAERIAKQWGLDKVTWFRQRVSSVEWDEDNKEWVTGLVQQLPKGKEGNAVKVRSRFMMLTTGIFAAPRVPLIPGIDKFKGSVFHTARWDYTITGGTPENPELTKLEDKRVGVIGTGATAIQVIPALSKWAKELHVFQRTPSAVDVRGNEPTNEEWARELYSKPGWQLERSLNWHKFVTNDPEVPGVNMVGDGWTNFRSLSALAGCRGAQYSTPEDMKKRIDQLQELDLPRQNSIRRRVENIVKDPTTAEALKPWYPGFCKRACFHDEYLDTFNKPNVNLVDTNGSGVERITENGLVVGGKEYEIDTLILSTGYGSPVLYSPSGRIGLDVIGRNGASFDKKWTTRLSTLHGMMTHDFPNFFWPALNQGGSSPNFLFTIDCSAQHVAKVVAHGAKAAGASTDSAPHEGGYRLNFTVEPSVEAEEKWSDQIVAGAGAFAATAGCTPSYFNAEGDALREAPVEEQLRRARGSLWPEGPLAYATELANWREKGNFAGLEVNVLDEKTAGEK